MVVMPGQQSTVEGRGVLVLAVTLSTFSILAACVTISRNRRRRDRQLKVSRARRFSCPVSKRELELDNAHERWIRLWLLQPLSSISLTGESSGSRGRID